MPMRAPDRIFADPRWASWYDVIDGDRADLDVYVSIVEEVGAHSIVDIGCGTGCLAMLLAERGFDVVGLDPAAASLDVARAKPFADLVTWVQGDATALDGERWDADLVVMTGNVAQVFVADEDWRDTLTAAHRCLRPGGWLAFETRRPEVRDWESWDAEPTVVSGPAGSSIEVTRTVTEVALPLVSFETQMTVGDEVLSSASTLRFRHGDELERDLRATGFEVVDVRDAPDRPGKELVFLARRPEA